MRVRITPEFPSLVISDTGEVWGPSGKRLTAFPDKDGYPRFNTYQGGRWTQHSVHTAVCTAYHGPRPDGQQVRHKDGNPANNRAENLCWGTQLENEEDKRKHGRTARGESHGMARLTGDDVLEIRAYPKFHGYREALSQRYGISPTQVSHIRSGKSWRHI